MNLRAVLSALIVSALLTFSGCSAPPIEAEVAQDLQSEVQQIAVLTARGDTADAVAAAHALSARVRTAQGEGRITGDRAVMILQRVEQLIDRLAHSGAAPAPADTPKPLAGPAVPAAPRPVDPVPVETREPEPQPAPEPEPSKAPDTVEAPDTVKAPDPVEAPDPVPTVEPEVQDGNPGSGSGSSGSGPGVPAIVDAADDDNDDDDGKGRGRGRGRSGGD